MKKKKRLLKKKLESFIRDESGSISKEKVLKIGLGTISALGIMSAFATNLVAAHNNHQSHANSLSKDPPIPDPMGHGGTCVRISHSSHASHTSHNSY